MLDKVERFRTYEAVVAKVKKLIDAGRLRSGDRLPPERDLARMLGTSRATVREACRVLEHMGLIESRIGAGRFISAPAPIADFLGEALLADTEDSILLDFVQVRVVLEIAMAELAARNATAEQIENLKYTLSLPPEGAERPEDYIAADLAFHGAVADASGNRIYRRFIDSTQFLRYRVGTFAMSAATRRAQIRGEHRRIYEAIAAGDAPAAAAAVREHMANVESQLRATLRQRRKST